MFALILLAFGMENPSADVSHVVDTDRAALADVMSRAAETISEFTVTTLNSRLLTSHDYAADDRDNWSEHFKVELSRSGTEYAWLSTIADPQDPMGREACERREPDVLTRWTGERLEEYLFRRRMILLSDTFPNSPETDCWAFFNYSDGPALYPARSLSSLLVDARIQSRSDEDALICYVLELGDPAYARFSINLLKEPHLRVSEAIVEILGADGNAKGRVRYWVQEWVEAGGLTWPAVAYRDATVLFPNRGATGEREPYRNRIVMRRVSITERELTSAKRFQPPDDANLDGWLVSDRLNHVKHMIGQNEVIVDGFRFATGTRLPKNIVEDLPKLLAGATPLQFTRRPDDTSSNRAPVWRTITLVVGSIVVYVGLRHWRRIRVAQVRILA